VTPAKKFDMRCGVGGEVISFHTLLSKVVLAYVAYMYKAYRPNEESNASKKLLNHALGA